MTQHFLYRLNKRVYPQYIFARAILREMDANKGEVLVDAPCGRGITSWHLSRCKDLEVMAYDQEPGLIELAQGFFKRNNVNYQSADVFQLGLPKRSLHYFCLINSLFLFKEYDRLLQNIRLWLNREGSLFLVVPNINSLNYENFKKKEGQVNHIEWDIEEVEQYLGSNGFDIRKRVPLCYTPFFGSRYYTLIMRFFPVLAQGLGYFYKARGFEPSYFLIKAKKSR